jgi:hypothetical protein
MSNLWHAVDQFHRLKADQYRPASELVKQLRTCCRSIGLAWWLEFPHLGITTDQELIQHTIERGARWILAGRNRSTVKLTTPHGSLARAEMEVRLLAAGVQQESVSWLAVAQSIAGVFGCWKTLPQFRRIALAIVPYPVPGTGPETPSISEARYAIETRLMQRATDRAVEEVTARDGAAMWIQFSHAFAGVVMNPTTDWAAIARQDSIELLVEEARYVA